MTATYQVRLECDVASCEHQFVANGSAVSVRRKARAAGWGEKYDYSRLAGRLDYCPQHSGGAKP